jgi:hypothetical protein
MISCLGRAELISQVEKKYKKRVEWVRFEQYNSSLLP